jgi:hypothetical protein
MANGTVDPIAEAEIARLKEVVRLLAAKSEALAADRAETLAEVERLRKEIDDAAQLIEAAAARLLVVTCRTIERQAIGGNRNAAIEALRAAARDTVQPLPPVEAGMGPPEVPRWSRWWCILSAIIAIGAFVAGSAAG